MTIVLRQEEEKRTLNMPVWNALYQVRNFAANVENVRAQDASGAPVEYARLRPASGKSLRRRAVSRSVTTFTLRRRGHLAAS